jgi:hypothetical protein
MPESGTKLSTPVHRPLFRHISSLAATTDIVIEDCRAMIKGRIVIRCVYLNWQPQSSTHAGGIAVECADHRISLPMRMASNSIV